ncbi:MAG: V-type ATP synthase subunit F, partial [Treponema sp.]
MKYSIIAERELVVAFSLVGVKGFIATSREEALLHFNSITSGSSSDMLDVKILIISEQISEYLHDEVNSWQLKGDYPLIVEIPCLQGAMEGKKSLQDAIREA